MKLEYLDDLSEGGKYQDLISESLIRLFDFDCSQARSLQKLIQENILEQNKLLNLGKVDFIEGLNCELTLVISDLNEGIELVENNRFECKMNLESYKHMVSIIQPFTEELSGFNWLDSWVDKEDQIDFLFSPGGGW